VSRVLKSTIEQQHRGTRIIVTCALIVYVILASMVTSVTLASGKSEDSAIDIVLDILRGDEEQMQAVAISMVREMPGTGVTKALAKELPNLSTSGQIQLLSALADRGDRAALPAVGTAANVSDESVRLAALRALERLGDASSVMFLAQRAATATGAEQKAARESLYRLRGSDVDKTILTNIERAEAAIKVELIRSIAQRNIHNGVKTLLKTAQDSDINVRLESFKALKDVADEEYLPALIELLLNVQGQSERREAENAIAVVANRIDDISRRADAVLAVLPSVKNVESRCSLLSVLGRIGSDNSLPVLEDAFNDEGVEVRDAAVRALSQWPNPAPIDILLKVAEESDNDTHRILALRGFVRLIGLVHNSPPEETVSLYRQAMDLALDASLKKLVLSGLADVESIAALNMAAEYLDDELLKQEAEFAVLKIAEIMHQNHPQETKTALQKVIQTTESDFVRDKAVSLMKKINGENTTGR